MLALCLLLAVFTYSYAHIPSPLIGQNSNDIFLPLLQTQVNKTTTEKSVFQHSNENVDDHLSYIDHLLGKASFFGDWYALDGKKISGLLQKEGFLFMHYGSDDEFAFGFEVFDGVYMDQRVLTILFDHKPRVFIYDSRNSYAYFK